MSAFRRTFAANITRDDPMFYRSPNQAELSYGDSRKLLNGNLKNNKNIQFDMKGNYVASAAHRKASRK